MLGSTGYLYEYDKLGNITKIQQGIKGADGTVISAIDKAEYDYDALSQLVRENNYDLNQTVVYTYNSGGNLLKKEIYALTDETEITSEPIDTITYAYENKNWKDQLTSYNGEAIEYDAIGNPTSYLGYTMNWFARELESLSGNGLDISYSYDENGMRLRKTVNGAFTEYQYEGSKLIYEKRGEQEFYYTYDGLGNLSSITYYNNNAKQEYFVLCNSRGDVTELYTENGDLAAHYIYDSWGNTISVTDKNGNEVTDTDNIGLLNPIRYRGYYLDFETGYYYLQSRYYNPTVGRFLNADGCVFYNGKILNTNIYFYCNNNPVNYSDPKGLYSESQQTLLDNAYTDFTGKYGHKLSQYNLVEVDPTFERKYDIVTVSYIYQNKSDEFQYECIVYFYGKVADIRSMADDMFNAYELNYERQIAFFSILGEFITVLIVAQIYILIVFLVALVNGIFINESDALKQKVEGLYDSDYYGELQSWISWNTRTNQFD